MKIGIIGGGAAGLMAAATIAEHGPEHEVFLIEKNNALGKKVMISGGGRCNVTTGIQEVRTVLTKYPRGNKFLTTAMYAFPPADVYQWFESHGVPLKIEEDLRVFPRSNSGKDIVNVFEKIFRSSHVRVSLKSSAIRVEKAAQGFLIHLKDHADPLSVDRLILTTGGQAYRHTGSTGDGYAFAIALGHSLTPLAPSLSSFCTKESWPASVSGLSFERAAISMGKSSFTGPLLFTHKGLSGPAAFALSSLIAFETCDQDHPLELSVDLFPDVSKEDLIESLAAKVQEYPKKDFSNVLALLVPKSLSLIVASELKLEEKHAGDARKTDVQRVVHWLKGIPLHAISRGAGDEFVTAGGIPQKEVNPRTMESLLCPGLYFAGEILDIDGFTGGFNLQASWATGRLAGVSILHRDA